MWAVVMPVTHAYTFCSLAKKDRMNIRIEVVLFCVLYTIMLVYNIDK